MALVLLSMFLGDLPEFRGLDRTADVYFADECLVEEYNDAGLGNDLVQRVTVFIWDDGRRLHCRVYESNVKTWGGGKVVEFAECAGPNRYYRRRLTAQGRLTVYCRTVWRSAGPVLLGEDTFEAKPIRRP